MNKPDGFVFSAISALNDMARSRGFSGEIARKFKPVSRFFFTSAEEEVVTITLKRIVERNREMKEYAIGEVFHDDENGVDLIVVDQGDAHGCEKCYAKDALCDHLPTCATSTRADGKSVYFKKVEEGK